MSNKVSCWTRTLWSWRHGCPHRKNWLIRSIRRWKEPEQDLNQKLQTPSKIANIWKRSARARKSRRRWPLCLLTAWNTTKESSKRTSWMKRNRKRSLRREMRLSPMTAKMATSLWKAAILMITIQSSGPKRRSGRRTRTTKTKRCRSHKSRSLNHRMASRAMMTTTNKWMTRMPVAATMMRITTSEMSSRGLSFVWMASHFWTSKVWQIFFPSKRAAKSD